jgi:hypothetical protein
MNIPGMFHAMRKSTSFIMVTSVNVLLFLILLIHARHSQEKATAMLRSSEELVRDLQLTDLCLFTEARYTRNPAMADLHAPFQDHPLALEHFPSGSLVTPPGFHREAP